MSAINTNKMKMIPIENIIFNIQTAVRHIFKSYSYARVLIKFDKYANNDNTQADKAVPMKNRSYLLKSIKSIVNT